MDRDLPTPLVYMSHLVSVKNSASTRRRKFQIQEVCSKARYLFKKTTVIISELVEVTRNVTDHCYLTSSSDHLEPSTNEISKLKVGFRLQIPAVGTTDLLHVCLLTRTTPS